MAALPDIITVAQLEALPEPGDTRYELHWGEVVGLTRPKKGQIDVQHRLSRLIGDRARNLIVIVECPYRALPEFEYRVADVAAISRKRWKAVDPDDVLRGSPELVVEVKSPSNTTAQLRDLVTLCLSTGALQCWIVDEDKKSVTVFNREGSTTAYGPGSEIPLTDFEGAPLPVDEIFRD